MALRALLHLLILGFALGESATCEEQGCESPNTLLLQTERDLIPLRTLEQKQQGLWKQLRSVKGSQGKTISVKDIYRSVLELAAAKVNASKADVDLVFDVLDKNHDGALDEAELHLVNEPAFEEGTAVMRRDGPDDPEALVVPAPDVPPPDASAAASAGAPLAASLAQTRGEWVWVDASGLWLEMYNEPRYFKPRVYQADGLSVGGCAVVSFIFGSSCWGYMYSNAATVQSSSSLCRCLPYSAISSSSIDWTWYVSSSDNYIYWYGR